MGEGREDKHPTRKESTLRAIADAMIDKGLVSLGYRQAFFKGIQKGTKGLESSVELSRSWSAWPPKAKQSNCDLCSNSSHGPVNAS